MWTRSHEDSKIPVEEAVQLDTSETPSSQGESIDATPEDTTDVTPPASGDASGEGQVEDNTTSEDSAEPGTTEDGQTDDVSTEPTDDEKAEAVEALESIRDVMLKSINHGGMDTDTVTVSNLAIEMVCNRVGIPVTRITASLEAFGESSSRRLLATNQAIDNINHFIETLK